MVVSDIKTSFGALLIGLLFSAFLFGFLTLQTYLYYRTFSKDSTTLKATVAVLWILNTLHLCFISNAQYHYLITNFLLPLANDVQLWSLSMHLGIGTVVTFIVQSFFVGRLWRLSGESALLVGCIIPLMVARLATGLATTVISITIGRFSEVNRERGWIIATFSSMVPADVIMTTAMVYFLHRCRPRINQKDTLIDTLLLYTLHTGLLPCILAVVSLTCYVTMDNNLIFIAVHFLLGQLYTSCMLVILNARVSVHGKGSYTTYPTTTTAAVSSKAFGKTAVRSGKRVTDSTQSSHRPLTHITTDSAASLEFRGIRPRSPSTPVYHVVTNAESESIASGSGVGSTAQGVGTLAPLHEEPTHALSVRSASDSTKSHLTGPSMSWESVTSSMERPARDLGDIEWQGGLVWQLGQSQELRS